VPKQMVADAAYDALMKFDDQLIQPGMQRYLQHINYVNIDAETTAVFIQTFSASASRDQHGDGDGDGDWRTAMDVDEDRAVRRFRSVEKQPAKQDFLWSTWRDGDTAAAAAAGRQRRSRDDVGPASSAAEPHRDVPLGQICVSSRPTPRRTQCQSSSPDDGYLT